jgi:hypothetical protein
LKSSAARCGVAPRGPVAQLSSPGFAFASAMRSCTDFAGTDGCTTSTIGELPTSVMGEKSRTGS